jgi:hypothetical protein
MKRVFNLAVLALCLSFAAGVFAANKVPTPSEFLGFTVGADHQLADYKQISAYFAELAKDSPRVQIEHLGPTTQGNDMILAAISTPENLKNKARYQEIARNLADPRGLTQQQIDALVKEGKTIVLVTCAIHASEIGSTQMSMEWAYALATSEDPVVKQRLENVILLLVPSLNPDGNIMEVNWYRKNLGTKYEGSRMPWMYHQYVGHDNNRDWFMLTQKETQSLTRAVYREWFPQVWLDEHQMGMTGPRIFTPPYADPVSHNLPPLLFRGVNLIGTDMQYRLEAAGKSGVIYGYSFDAYWPAGTKNTAWFKNIVGLLTEVASVKLASPVNVAPTELSGGSKGLIEYGKQINFLNPWPGGTWRLRDIMDYERIASDALLETTSDHREDYLRGAATMAQESINLSKADEAYRIPAQQRDPIEAAKLAHLLDEHNVNVLVDEKSGDFYVPLHQPYGRFVIEMLGIQRYPKVKPVAGGNILPPYDVAAWSLPLMMGVTVEKTTLVADRQKTMRGITNTDWPAAHLPTSPVIALPRTTNASIEAVNLILKNGGKVNVAPQPFVSGDKSYDAGTFVIENGGGTLISRTNNHDVFEVIKTKPAVLAALHAPRVGLYKSWTGNIDEGWTRFILEQYAFNQQSIDNKAIKAGNLRANYDVIILPDMNKDLIVEGKYKPREGETPRYLPDLPPEYAGGIGKEGVQALKKFVEDGGTLITLAAAGELITDEFGMPVRNTLARAKQDDFMCPGSLLRVKLDTSNPVAWGMPDEVAAFVDEGIAYQTSVPGSELDRSVIGWYPEDEEDILLSGWIRGADRLQRKSAIVSFTQGKGKIVMLGFRVQQRAQTEGTFKLLFNSILWAGMEEAPVATAAASSK